MFIKNAYENTVSINGKKLIKLIMNTQALNEARKYYRKLSIKENNLNYKRPSNYTRLARNQQKVKATFLGKSRVNAEKIPSNLPKHVIKQILNMANIPVKPYNHYKHYAFE
jgi:hypothetical protein